MIAPTRLRVAFAVAMAFAGSAATAAGASGADTSRSTAVARADKPFPEPKLQALMPEHIGAWTRVKLGNPLTGSEHDVAPAMQAQYARGDARVDVEVLDVGKAAALAAQAAVRAAAAPTSAAGERFYRAHGHVVREEHAAGADVSSASVFFDNGLNVRASGHHLDGDALRQVIDGLGLGAASGLKRGGS